MNKRRVFKNNDEAIGLHHNEREKSQMNNETREARLRAYNEAVEAYQQSIKPKNVLIEAPIKRGDIFYTSWGYDQTNYDFLVILEVSKTGKTAKCQMTNRLNMGHDGGSCDVVEPIFCPYGDVFTMHVRQYAWDNSKTIHLKGSYPYCNDGSMKNSRLDSFTPHTIGKQYHETDAYSGH